MSGSFNIRNLKLTEVQKRILTALTHGATLSAAAEANGVHRATIHRWARQQCAFSRAVAHAKRTHAENILDELRGLSREAMDVLRDLLRSPDSPASVRCRAALAVVEAAQSAAPIQNDDPEERQISRVINSFSEADLEAAVQPAHFRPRATDATAPAVSTPEESDA